MPPVGSFPRGNRRAAPPPARHTPKRSSPSTPCAPWHHHCGIPVERPASKWARSGGKAHSPLSWKEGVRGALPCFCLNRVRRSRPHAWRPWRERGRTSGVPLPASLYQIGVRCGKADLGGRALTRSRPTPNGADTADALAVYSFIPSAARSAARRRTGAAPPPAGSSPSDGWRQALPRCRHGTTRGRERDRASANRSGSSRCRQRLDAALRHRAGR
jgi:hypothetical protein